MNIFICLNIVFFMLDRSLIYLVQKLTPFFQTNFCLFIWTMKKKKHFSFNFLNQPRKTPFYETHYLIKLTFCHPFFFSFVLRHRNFRFCVNCWVFFVPEHNCVYRAIFAAYSRVSVMRGQVITPQGLGIIGIRVSVDRDSRFGFTLTRQGGW